MLHMLLVMLWRAFAVASGESAVRSSAMMRSGSQRASCWATASTQHRDTHTLTQHHRIATPPPSCTIGIAYNPTSVILALVNPPPHSTCHFQHTRNKSPERSSGTWPEPLATQDLWKTTRWSDGHSQYACSHFRRRPRGLPLRAGPSFASICPREAERGD